mgnify:CR=1 FL=1
MATTKQNTSQCRQCKQRLIDISFYYNDKLHKTCFSCSKIRISKQNICSICGIRAIYNIIGETIGIRCSSHRDANMVNIKSSKCITCKNKCPSFNHIGETKALYCSGCAEPNMVDIKSPKCITCKKRASYGIPGFASSMCVKHKTDNMISKPRSKCKKENCKLNAIYGIKYPIHCETHKNENDINLTETKCEECGLLDVCINGLCINTCSDSEKITYEMKRRQKVKEVRVLKILESEYGKPHEYNVHVSSKCGGKNSEEKEFGYDFGTHKLYIEVDENQHKSYCELGEINRMKNIYMDDGGIPVIFIRYNPDNYKIDGKKQNISPQKREIELLKWVKYYQNVDNIQGYDLSVQYLFYTGGDNAKLHNIEPYANNKFLRKSAF